MDINESDSVFGFLHLSINCEISFGFMPQQMYISLFIRHEIMLRSELFQPTHSSKSIENSI